MKARSLFTDSAAYGPEELKKLFKAFDDAWDVLAPEVSGRPEAIEAARMRLANIILGLASNGTIDPEQLARMAVGIMSGAHNEPPAAA